VCVVRPAGTWPQCWITVESNASNSPTSILVKTQASGNGKVKPHQELPGAMPKDFALTGVGPNPFNPSTTIGFGVPAPGGEVKLTIFNVRGQVVRRLVDGYKAPGFHTETWDGTDDHGEPVASGVFFVRMTAEDFSDIKKIVLLK
jgi:hypothetical protein